MKYVALALLFAGSLASCASKLQPTNQGCDPDREVGPPNPQEKHLVVYDDPPPAFREFNRHSFEIGGGSQPDWLAASRK